MTPQAPDDRRKPGIVLTGPRGCGKSTVGRELVSLVGGDFVDTDELIAQQAAASIAAIFESEGEAAFRAREHQAIQHVAANPPAVLSVGGGAVLDTQNTELLRSIGKVIWLTASAQVLWERISADANSATTRPALTDTPGLQEVEHSLAERSSYYESAADFIVDTTGLSPEDVAREIVRRLAG